MPARQGEIRPGRETIVDVNTILQVLTLGGLAAAAYVLVLVKTGTEAAVKVSAEEAPKATIQQLK